MLVRIHNEADGGEKEREQDSCVVLHSKWRRLAPIGRFWEVVWEEAVRGFWKGESEESRKAQTAVVV